MFIDDRHSSALLSHELELLTVNTLEALLVVFELHEVGVWRWVLLWVELSSDSFDCPDHVLAYLFSNSHSHRSCGDLLKSPRQCLGDWLFLLPGQRGC